MRAEVNTPASGQEETEGATPEQASDAPPEQAPDDAPPEQDSDDAPPEQASDAPPEQASDDGPPEQEPAPAEAPRPSVHGDLRAARSGPVRVLLLVTGLALIAWLVRGLLALLGYRHPTTLVLQPGGALLLRGERRFMGLGMGATRRVVPAGAVQLVDLVGRSGLWALAAAAVVLAFAAAVGAALFFWGLAGREPSWILAGLLVVGAGIFLDGVAYLWSRRAGRRGLATLRIRSPGARMTLRGVEQESALRLVRRIARGDAE